MADQTKQEIVFNMVKAGQYTRDEIKDAAGCPASAFASYLSTMRTSAKFTGSDCCPVEVEDGDRKIFKAVTFEAAEAIKDARPTGRKSTSSKTPEERAALVAKRLEKLTNAYERAVERVDLNPDNRAVALRATIAKAQLELAELEAATLPMDSIVDVGLDDDYDDDDVPGVSAGDAADDELL